MTQKIPTDIVRLQDMLAAMRDARAMAASGLQERKDIFSTAYAIAIIGEAANHVSATLQRNYPDIPWRDIIGMRHKIIHEYGKVNVKLLGQVVRQDIPLLEAQIEKILHILQTDTPPV